MALRRVLHVHVGRSTMPVVDSRLLFADHGPEITTEARVVPSGHRRLLRYRQCVCNGLPMHPNCLFLGRLEGRDGGLLRR